MANQINKELLVLRIKALKTMCDDGYEFRIFIRCLKYLSIYSNYIICLSDYSNRLMFFTNSFDYLISRLFQWNQTIEGYEF